VLFECLTGRPAFVGKDPIDALAKILLGGAPRCGKIREDVPPALDAIVARMLAKDAAQRPADGAEVLAEVDALDGAATAPEPIAPRVTADLDAPRPIAPPRSLSRAEKRLVSVIAASAEAVAGALAARIAPFGGRLERLADGSVAIALHVRGAATDLA